MTDPIFTFHSAASRKRKNYDVSHSIEKQESMLISKFQSIAYFLRKIDTVVAHDSFLGSLSRIHFGCAVDTLGYDEYAPVHILSAPNWKIRMYAAWCILGSDERNIAASLNYDDFQNYWPDISFRDPGWDDEVKQWAASATSHEASTHPVELQIAKLVGQPSRPPILYAA
jgi:hypothetical protein